MKKYLVMMMCAGLLFTATGCGDEKKEEESSSKSDNTVETNTDNKKGEESKSKNQVLRCSDTDGDEYVEYVFTFDKDGEEITKTTANLSMEFDDDEMDEVDEDEFNSYCDFYADEDGVTSCKASFKGNKFSLDLEINIDDFGYYDFDSKTSIDEVKKAVESEDDVVCKIEK